MISNLRIVLALSYVALLFWHSGGVSGGVPDDWWRYLFAYGLLSMALHGAERLQIWWVWRRAVRRMRSLDPAERDAKLARMWLSGVRVRIAARVRDEGEVEVINGMERFPFARGARRAMVAIFWSSAVIGIGLQVMLIVGVPRGSRGVGWVMLSVGTALAVVAAWARRRTRHMETMLEVGPFTIAEVYPGGERRAFRWSDALLLRVRARLRRLELSVAGRPDYIALDYDRVGIERAVRLVLERGGFDAPVEEIETGVE